MTATSVAGSCVKALFFAVSSFSPGPGRFMLSADVFLTVFPLRLLIDGHTSPARFLAYLLAEHDISVTQLCNRSGMDSDAARGFLAGLLPVTPALADQLGKVSHTLYSG